MSAEDWLSGLDPLGWRFGLERINALLDSLGRPQDAFVSVHVVGTNGKSSVTAMVAALAQEHGLRAGAYLSPHADRWAERIRIGGKEIDPVAFDAAAARVRESIADIEATLDARDRVTQFEAVTATAFVALAEAGVEVAGVEAGLGGRLDATNVLHSRVTALTSVGLDHTELLGDTELEIAAEKLAVLREGTVLVVGELPGAVAELASRRARERGARYVDAGDSLKDLEGHSQPKPSADWAPYMWRNLGVALACVRELYGSPNSSAVTRAIEGLQLPGRLEVVAGDPPLILDAAHNPDGARALAEALPRASGGRPVVACVAMLADKDAAGVLEALAPGVALFVCTEIPSARLQGAGRPGTTSITAADLSAICAAVGVEAIAIADPVEAAAEALRLARERCGVALAAGSHYLLGYAWTARHAQSSSR